MTRKRIDPNVQSYVSIVIQDVKNWRRDGIEPTFRLYENHTYLDNKFNYLNVLKDLKLIRYRKMHKEEAQLSNIVEITLTLKFIWLARKNAKLTLLKEMLTNYLLHHGYSKFFKLKKPH